MPLDLLAPGERGEITEVRHCGGCGGGCHNRHAEHSHDHHKDQATPTRAEEMGLRVGKSVEVLTNDEHLLLLLVDGARITIDRRMARNISVKGVTA